MGIKPEDNPAEGEAKLRFYELVGEAAKCLQKSPVLPVLLLRRAYGVARLDQMSLEQLQDLISKGKQGTLFVGLQRS